MNGKEARERQKALGASPLRGLGLYGSGFGEGSFGADLVVGMLLGLVLMLAMSCCDVKLKVEIVPAKVEEKK